MTTPSFRSCSCPRYGPRAPIPCLSSRVWMMRRCRFSSDWTRSKGEAGRCHAVGLFPHFWIIRCAYRNSAAETIPSPFGVHSIPSDNRIAICRTRYRRAAWVRLSSRLVTSGVVAAQALAQRRSILADHSAHEARPVLAGPRFAKYAGRDVEVLLHGPDVIVALWRPALRRTADGHPADRHGGALFQHSVDVHHAVDAHFGPLLERRAIEDGRAGGDENFVLQSAACQMCVRAHHHVCPQRAIVRGGTANHRVLHHDGVLADADGAAVGHQDDAVADHCAGTYLDLTAKDCCRGDGGGGMDACHYEILLSGGGSGDKEDSDTRPAVMVAERLLDVG